MHRIGIITDVHADVHALQDALQRMDDTSCDEIVCCGDLVDYGLFPDETLALLAERRVPCVRGNHDRWALAGDALGGGSELSRASRRFLAGLPPSLLIERRGVRVAFHHASPPGDMNGIDPVAITLGEARELGRLADADLLVVGHTHVVFRLDVDGGRGILNPGALLRSPADGAENPPATGTYGLLELPSGSFSVHRASDGTPVDILCRRLSGQ